MSELKTCPFCNKQPGEVLGLDIIHCENCQISLPKNLWETRPPSELVDVEAKAKELYERYEQETGLTWICKWEELAQRFKDFDMYLIRESQRFGTRKIPTVEEIEKYIIKNSHKADNVHDTANLLAINIHALIERKG